MRLQAPLDTLCACVEPACTWLPCSARLLQMWSQHQQTLPRPSTEPAGSLISPAGILHTILFHRTLGALKPVDVESELLDLTYVR